MLSMHLISISFFSHYLIFSSPSLSTNHLYHKFFTTCLGFSKNIPPLIHLIYLCLHPIIHNRIQLGLLIFSLVCLNQMDIPDQQIKQLAAAAAPHTFLPSNYMHSLQTVDSFSPHFPNYNVLQPSLIMNSSNLNDISSMHKTPDTATAHMSSPRIVFNPSNSMNMASINAGLEQIPGLYKTTYDYSFSQIYNDQANIFNIAGVDPHDNIHSTEELNHDQKFGKVSADPNSAAKQVLSSGCLSMAFASHEVSHEDARRPVEYSSTRKIVKSEPDMDHILLPASLMTSVSGYASASSTGTSLLHSLGDMESFKEETYFDQRRSAFDHIEAVASTSSSALDHHHHFFDFANLPSFSVKDMNPSMITSHHSNSSRGINEKHTSSNSKASCTHLGTETTISTPTRCKTQVAPKRRKSQQKRVVCVPATGGLDRPTGECLPSDSWAWRKYGQKPIKNSPYPRSYYKCSSVKGCTARKQVERNPSDPLIIIITYTVEHSHPSAAAAEPLIRAKGTTDQDEEEEEDDDAEKQSPQLIDKQMMISVDGTDAISEESCEPISSEGTYHDVNNEENMVTESAHDIEDHHFEVELRAHENDDSMQEFSSMLEGGLMESKSSDGINNHVGLVSSSSYHHQGSLKKTLSSHEHRGKAEEDVFSQLDELPDLFGRNLHGWPHDHTAADHQGGINVSPTTHINIDPFDLYYWP